MIDNLANLQGATLGTITVAADQDSGIYVLAQGAEAFTGSLTIKALNALGKGGLATDDYIHVLESPVLKVDAGSGAGAERRRGAARKDVSSRTRIIFPGALGSRPGVNGGGSSANAASAAEARMTRHFRIRFTAAASG